MPGIEPPLELIDAEVVQKAMPGPKHSKWWRKSLPRHVILRERIDVDFDAENVTEMSGAAAPRLVPNGRPNLSLRLPRQYMARAFL